MDFLKNNNKTNFDIPQNQLRCEVKVEYETLKHIPVKVGVLWS